MCGRRGFAAVLEPLIASVDTWTVSKGPDASHVCGATIAFAPWAAAQGAAHQRSSASAPAAAASYSLIGAILLLGGIGYGCDLVAAEREPGASSAG